MGWAGQGEGLKHGINLWAWECPTARRASEGKDVKQGSVLRSVELQYSYLQRSWKWKTTMLETKLIFQGACVFHVHDDWRKSIYRRVNLRYLCHLWFLIIFDIISRLWNEADIESEVPYHFWSIDLPSRWACCVLWKKMDGDMMHGCRHPSSREKEPIFLEKRPW